MYDQNAFDFQIQENVNSFGITVRYTLFFADFLIFHYSAPTKNAEKTPNYIKRFNFALRFLMNLLDHF